MLDLVALSGIGTYQMQADAARRISVDVGDGPDSVVSRKSIDAWEQ
jgi:hypothetical protein